MAAGGATAAAASGKGGKGAKAKDSGGKPAAKGQGEHGVVRQTVGLRAVVPVPTRGKLLQFDCGAGVHFQEGRRRKTRTA